jgi:hypothetical protein
MARSSGPFGESRVRSTAGAESFWNKIWPPTMRPGGSTI